MRKISYVLLLFLLTSCSTLQPGDLLFHVVEQDNVITAVTPGMIDHVAIVISKDSVIEAVGQGVKTTPIDSLRLQSGYYLIGKVKGIDRKQSLQNARQYLGHSYDHLFLADNEAIYCSELVQLSFVNDKGEALFTCIPMSFHDASGNILSYWTQFYARYQMDVPEGQPGTNPGELSQRSNIRLAGRIKKSKTK